MGIVYGRMNFNRLRPESSDIAPTSCPSKVKPTGRSQVRNSADDGNASSDSLPTPRITRQASRNQARRQQPVLRRSARLRGVSASSAPEGLDDGAIVQTRVRRSARIARIGSAASSDSSSRGSAFRGRRQVPAATTTNNRQVVLRRSARIRTRRS